MGRKLGALITPPWGHLQKVYRFKVLQLYHVTTLPRQSMKV